VIRINRARKYAFGTKTRFTGRQLKEESHVLINVRIPISPARVMAEEVFDCVQCGSRYLEIENQVLGGACSFHPEPTYER
jgi:hypothetical protein